MVLGIQIAGICFGLFMIYYSFLHYKRKEITAREFIFWIILWTIFSYIALFPQALDFMVERLQLSRTMDLLIIVGFMALTLMFIYIYNIMRRNQRKLEEIVQRIAKGK